jgi:hypothetical protein
MQLALAKQRTDAFDGLVIDGIEKLRAAKVLEDVLQVQSAQQRVFFRAGFMIAVSLGAEQDYRKPLVLAPEKPINPRLKIRIAQKNDHFIDVMKLDPLVSVLFEEISIADLSTLAFDPFRNRGILDQKQH